MSLSDASVSNTVEPGGEGSAAPPGGRMSSAEVARRALAVSVAVLVRALARVLVEDDPEWIHQARSATRSLRTNLAAFKPLLDGRERSQLQARLRGLAHALGVVRDADVLVVHVGTLAQRLPPADAPAAHEIVACCRALRADAHARLIEELRDEVYPRLLEDLVRAVCRDSPLIANPTAVRRRDLAYIVVGRPWRRLRRAVRRCGTSPSTDDLHAIRILAKRCRCAAEAVAPPSRTRRGIAARRFVARLTRLQDTLGTLHDAVNESHRLRAFSASKVDRFVAGEIAGLEDAVAAAARESWRGAWRKARRRDAHFWRR